MLYTRVDDTEFYKVDARDNNPGETVELAFDLNNSSETRCYSLRINYRNYKADSSNERRSFFTNLFAHF